MCAFAVAATTLVRFTLLETINVEPEVSSTFHGTEEIIIEVEEESEFEVRKTAVNLLLGASVRGQPENVPETAGHSVDELSVYKMV